MSFFKWLYPGLKVKRWIFLCFIGALLTGTGLAIIGDIAILGFFENIVRQGTQYFTGRFTPTVSGPVIALAGVVLAVIGFRNTVRSIIAILVPPNENRLVDVLYQKQHLKKGPKIVVIGGGTGLSVLLRGLKEYTSNITAIVTVADDGGSSGRLRGELGILPPGDIRNCLVALADTETLMDELFQHRFPEESNLAGHSLGNLFLAAMTEIAGDFEKAIKEMSKVLAIRGQVLPATLRDVALCAELTDGSVIEGESKIPQSGMPIKNVFLKPGDCRPLPEALLAIGEADIIVLGPGSLYTSVIPNLLVKGIPETIRSSRAVKLYICNIMTQHGETDGYSASRHVQALIDHAGPGLVDYVLLNVSRIPDRLLERYRQEEAHPVLADIKALEKMGIKVIMGKMVTDTDLVRHDPPKLAKAIIGLVVRIKAKNEPLSFLDFYAWGERFKNRRTL